jgi:hypothetical protein
MFAEAARRWGLGVRGVARVVAQEAVCHDKSGEERSRVCGWQVMSGATKGALVVQ